jgi:PHP family Zn ribbon phosphoesterase
MTLANIALYARRKGIDVIGTGDCLQSLWLTELEGHLVPAEEGWFALTSPMEADVLAQLSVSLREPLRFVLSTEINCAPPGAGEFDGIHQLVYFSSFESVRKLRGILARHGDLSEGRPTVRLSSAQLLEIVVGMGDDTRMAPAHVMNPYFSSLGSQRGHQSLEEVFGANVSQLLAAETGLTSTPSMCRRVSSLDSLALFSCSDAHSLENIGRECTLIDAEPGYAQMMEALAGGERNGVVGRLKVPIQLTRYYLNWCPRCARSYDREECPQGHGSLATGSRDWLEVMADRAVPLIEPEPSKMLLPLKLLLGGLCQQNWKGKEVAKHYDRLLTRIGSERKILTEAAPELIATEFTPQLANEIAAQREKGFLGRLSKFRQAPAATDSQMPLL